MTSTYLSRQTTTCVKGLLALVIVLAHCRTYRSLFNGTILGMVLTASGYLAVGLFFFFSGYGLHRQLSSRGDSYLKHFGRNRILPTYAVYCLTLAVYILFMLVTGQPVYAIDVLRSLTFGDTLAANGWYMQALLLLYVLFLVCYRLFSHKWAPLLLSVCYLAACALFAPTPLWVQSVLCFPLGLLWSTYQSRIEKLLFAKYWLSLPMVLLLFCLFFLPGNLNTPTVPKVICRMFSACLFSVLVLLLCAKISVLCKPLLWLGEISFELYLFHGLFLNLFRDILPLSPLPYIVAVFLCSIVFAAAVHPFFNRIQTSIKCRKTP